MNDAVTRALALPVTLLLIASVAIVTVLGWVIKPLQSALILSPFRVRHSGHLHRLLTAGWVHSNVSHLVFNMLSLYFFAGGPLKVLGAAPFLALYISAVIMAFIPTTLRHMGDPQYNSLGASGAVAAVMFSAILLDPKLKLYLFFIPIPVPAVAFAVGYLAYSAWQASRPSHGVNHAAHFSGAVYGVIFTYIFERALVEKALKGIWP